MKVDMKSVLAIASIAVALAVTRADETNVVCEGGVCRLVDAPKVVCEGGVCRLEDIPWNLENATAPADTAEMRLAQGYMPADEFIQFLKGEETSSPLPSSFFLLPFFLLLAGLALNLTPCVLPMIPVNLIVIGQSVRRGILYGLGIALAYGALGVAAAVGGMAFGTIQSSPWFNVGVAAVFVALGLALAGVFHIDFSARRFRAGAFLMGVLSAVLAGACVAPVLVSVLLLTADLSAKGNRLALFLPFLVGVGMALPWPFLGAGMKVLPKPGAWMKWVNRVFAVIVFGFAAWYGTLAWRGFAGGATGAVAAVDGVVEATPETFADALKSAKRPVLVDCWASWCKNCAAMDVVMSENQVREELKRYTVIKLQAEDIGELRKLPGFGAVQGLPAFGVIEGE